jgi:hypothetical protein
VPGGAVLVLDLEYECEHSLGRAIRASNAVRQASTKDAESCNANETTLIAVGVLD